MHIQLLVNLSKHNDKLFVVISQGGKGDKNIQLFTFQRHFIGANPIQEKFNLWKHIFMYFEHCLFVNIIVVIRIQFCVMSQNVIKILRKC